MRFGHIKEGDKIVRLLSGLVPMTMTVERVDDILIHCAGGWTFDRETGVEVDDDLRWGPDYGQTGSFLTLDWEPQQEDQSP